MTVIPLDEAGARLTVDLTALQKNYRLLASQAAKSECAVVVKANAYGLGLEQCVQALSEAGARTFFVAQVSEARRLRQVASGATIYVLSGFAPGSAPRMREISARPVLGCTEEIEEWAALCAQSGDALPAALHIDTGINRVGVTIDEAKALAHRADLFGKIDLTLVMSHLACADVPGHEMNDQQLADFASICGLFPSVPKCLANSAATLQPNFKSGAYHYDMVRPGVALYGLRAVTGRENLMHNVATLEARVIQIRNIPPGAHIGYGATYRTKKPSRIAILSVGYADGYFRSLGAATNEKRAYCAFDGQRIPVVGRISMDLIAVDVSDTPKKRIRRGSFVEVMGPNIPADELADLADTIGYEVLTRLGARFNRVYLKDGIEQIR